MSKQFIDPDDPFSPVKCICIPVAQREEELPLLTHAQIINNGPCIDKVMVFELLEMLTYLDDHCSGICNKCRYEHACNVLTPVFKEVF